MSQDFRSSHITGGAGGAGSNGGVGGRGGDVGAHNYNNSRVTGSNNDNRYQRRIKGDNYDGTVYQGDTFNGPISNGIVGGRHNTNTYTVKNHGSSSDDDVKKAISDAEERKRLAIQKLEALKKKKEEREKLRRIEEEARQLEEQAKQIEAELEEDSQTSG